ncbi:MAG: hypothetical protein K0B87_04110 [Candidatus Syntrophosphaera sp.]|nr:hypothetical protein [Candidatus Syntrophosphaera sp.]
MRKIQRVINGIFRLLFGEFNGVQVFLYPMTLFWWMDSYDFYYAMTGLLTKQRHLFPLSIFLLLLLYVLFLIIKNSSAILKENGRNTETEKRSLYAMVINLHKILLIAVLAVGLVYVLAAFLKYYYAIHIPLKMFFPYIFRGFSVFLIIFYTLINTWTKPFRLGGLSMNRSIVRVRRQYRQHPELYGMHALVLVMMIVIGSFIYNLMVLNLFYPVVGAIGFSPDLFMTVPSSIPALLYDIFILGVAFMLSNLLFSPIVMIISFYSDKLHPHLQLAGNAKNNAETD